MAALDRRTTESLARSYEDLQHRFSGRIEVVKPRIVLPTLDPASIVGAESRMGFRDISARAEELSPLVGRVVLYPNTRTKAYQPAVITDRNNKMQMTVLDQPFDPSVGISEGMLFALGVKNDTASPTFGTHTASKGYEAGHFAPVMVGARSAEVSAAIINNGDTGTHSVGSDVGGVPEKMIQTGLLPGVRMQTVQLDRGNNRRIPLFWHPSLERGEGIMAARYDGPTDPVKLMLGAASAALGPRALDDIGNLVEASTRGV